jgi:hypothetical protein
VQTPLNCVKLRPVKFLSLTDGTVVNLNAVAYFRVDSSPRLPDKPRGIEVFFPSAAINEFGGIEHHKLLLEGKDATDFLDAMQKHVDTTKTRKAAGLPPLPEYRRPPPPPDLGFRVPA